MRVALQINPFAYVGKNAPSTKFPNEAAYNAALVAELMKLGVGLIAISDHWRAQTARGLITACDSAGIVALPGFEANSSEGIHLLVVFSQDTDPGADPCGRCDWWVRRYPSRNSRYARSAVY